MRVLAIDPGNTESAYCYINAGSLQPKVFDKVENADLLEHIRSFDSLMPCSRPDVVVIERVASYGMAVGKEVFQTCEWIGRYTEAADAIGLPVHYIYRQEEKLHICKDSRAKDANIRRALIDRFARHDLKNGRGTKDAPDWFYGFRADIWAAYAVGITWIEKEKRNDR